MSKVICVQCNREIKGPEMPSRVMGHYVYVCKRPDCANYGLLQTGEVLKKQKGLTEIKP